MTTTTTTTTGVLRSHLEGELDRLHKERRTALVLGALVVALVAGYCLWLDRQAAYWSKPDHLALTAAGLVEASLPSLKRTAADTIRSEAPALARYVGESVSAEVPRLVRGMVGTMVTQYSGSLADYAARRYGEAFKALIDGARTELAAAAATDDNDEQQRLVVAAIERQVRALGAQVEGGSLNADPLFKQIEASHQALANLNARLQRMVKQSDRGASRKDKLTKRFLGTFWRFVQQENPDVKAEDGAPGDGGGAAR
jgi:hypothetical protein